MGFKITRSQRLSAVIGISTVFFVAEISIGFYTHSLALVADAFHYLNDLIGFIVALVALRVSETNDAPKSLSFGWQRAQLLGAFFNGALLFALGISVFLQSIERFISLQYVENPKLMFMMGAVGLGLNLISAIFLHEHDHGHGHHGHSAAPLSPIPPTSHESDISEHRNHKHQLHGTQPTSLGHDLGMLGVLLHVVSDAANNLGVMTAALVIWLAHYEGRYYADPGTSMGIAMMIMLSSLPLVRRSGLILLESAPNGLDPADVKHDLEKVPGVLAIHELHIWRLNQHKTLASVHVVVSDPSVENFAKTTKTMNECFHAYGIHSATLQPEMCPLVEAISTEHESAETMQELRKRSLEKCQVLCGTLCEELTCCG
ncbi:cation diffusion facilitator family metal ion transporter [Aspergillus pseudonomiae]|uniref:Cation diffusion facilitator family metal ion transporter n=1 Tax=Aspergillus pseudonomiae TaxID=1506151 RepID=A0A5N7CST0_9EURO|nr:cation diffusion facilitator family metal ion transporter [Aspergillus pseudonomiae]KAE8397205.1 cation diffusion facilitator family metal ion transporter [Aspergillus pseudonomiae]